MALPQLSPAGAKAFKSATGHDAPDSVLAPAAAPRNSPEKIANHRDTAEHGNIDAATAKLRADQEDLKADHDDTKDVVNDHADHINDLHGQADGNTADIATLKASHDALKAHVFGGSKPDAKTADHANSLNDQDHQLAAAEGVKVSAGS